MSDQIKIESTDESANSNLNILVYGPSGVGKTRLCATTGGKPIVLNVEGGLLSLKGEGIDTIKINNVSDIAAAYNFLLSDNTYDWVCVDSLSEVGQVFLDNEKTKTTNIQRAYGEMATKLSLFIKDMQLLEKNVYFSCKLSLVKDEITGGFMFGPRVPGKLMLNDLSYFFDEVFAMHSWVDDDGAYQTALQTRRDARYDAKDCSRKLNTVEPANLSVIYNKIMGE